jgi:hypothetical protein
VRRYWYSVFLYLVCINLASCTNKRLLLQPPASGVQIAGVEKLELVANLKSKTNFPFIRGMLNTEVKSSAGKDGFLQALTFKAPDFFRLEAFATGANALVFIAVSNGSEFKAIIPGEKQVLIGKPSTKALSTLIQIPVTPRELVALVTGNIFPEFLDSEISLLRVSDETIFIVARDNSQRELRAILDNKTSLRVQDLSLSDGGSGVLNVHYSYQLGELKLISVTLPDIEGKVEVKELKDSLVNPINAEKLFILNQPAGYSVRRID